MVAVTNLTYSASSFVVTCCSMKENQHDHLNSNNNIRVNGSAFRSPIKVESLSQTAEAAPITFVENSQRQNIPTKKQLVDHHRQGLIVEGGVGYRQTVVIRSYEVGADKTATLESILNLLQVINSIYIITLFLLFNYD
jgi:fatty acyl-ACP thioesterase B